MHYLLIFISLNVCITTIHGIPLDQHPNYQRRTLMHNKYMMQRRHQWPLYKINYVCTRPEILDVYVAQQQYGPDFKLIKAKKFCKCYMKYIKFYKIYNIRKLAIMQYSVVNCNRLYLDILDAYLVYALHYFTYNQQNKYLGIILTT